MRSVLSYEICVQHLLSKKSCETFIVRNKIVVAPQGCYSSNEFFR
jgi:hypothetical protein